jgi:outer membrane protein assembly factor BamA
MIFSKIGVRQFSLFAIGVIMFSCQSTKYVPEGSFLLNRIEIENPTKDISTQELKSYIRQKENLRILGFWKFHLGLYNLSGKDSTKGFNKWLRKIGEEPIIYDDYLAQLSTSQLNTFLQNKGYFRSVVKDSAIRTSPKKVKVSYQITLSNRYYINKVGYLIEDDSLRAIIESDTARSLLKSGRPFDSNVHDQERERITDRLQNNGYYAFSKEYIYFVADSSIGNYHVNDSLILKKALDNDTLGVNFETVHSRFKYRKVYYYVDSDVQKVMDAEKAVKYDTLEYAKCYFLFQHKIEVHPTVIYNSSHIIPGDVYNAGNVEKTQLLLSSLPSFKYVNISFREVADSSNGLFRYLDAYIQMVPASKQAFTVEVEGTNSSGNFGVAGNIKFQNRNLLRGAEVFNLGLRSSIEREFIRNTKDKFNTFEIGTDAGLEFPKFLVPYQIESFRKRYNPKTTIDVAYNYQRRPDYTRTIASIRFGYNWKPTRFVTHYLFPTDLNLVRLPYINPDFWDDIDSTFLKYSYEDHFILNSAYSLVFNNQLRPNQKEFTYGRFNFELGGNILNAIVPLWQDYNAETGYEIFGIRFAQYVKSDIDLRYHQAINNVSSIAYRFFTGVGYPYGNLKVLPFEKRYFTGGANGIRAWPVRGLGPGTYSDPTTTYYNQTADIKLEMNAEYRFKLFWILEGAMYFDAGNIWCIRPEGSVDGGMFKWNTFYKQIALGSGAGIRFDFDYFLIRIDSGIKVIDPTITDGGKWVLVNESLKWKNIAFNFAVGYPF